VQDLAALIVGNSAPIVALREYLPKVARSTANVLITGATGTGKECVARALHQVGLRRNGPFVAINCAAMPEGLVESELFGRERGAYTHADTSARGQIAAADGGTLFLDEIGDMALPVQAKLLRVIEQRQVVPLGSTRPVPVDIRVVAAANRPLESLVAEQRFRADLFYRLNVARLDLPPLHERREDIGLLVRHIVSELNFRERREVGELDGELLRAFMRHDWPGNVRELRNVIEAVFIDPPLRTIGFDDLPPGFRRIFAAYRTAPQSDRDRIMSALERTNWNKAEAARQLHWSRMTLYRKLAKYRVDRSA